MIYAHEAPWSTVVAWGLGALAFLLYWGKIDGTDRWMRKQREAEEKALADGWRKWHEGKWRIGEQ